MMMRALILILVTAAGWCSAAGAVEVKYWDRLPLAIPLTVGQERILILDEDVRVGLPSAIASKLRVQSVGGTVYLRAAEALPPNPALKAQCNLVVHGDLAEPHSKCQFRSWRHAAKRHDTQRRQQLNTAPFTCDRYR
jgi:hypothetical protein